ncbi:DUF3817 domain-containing protein [Catellatospora tritici]|uniref:DUF3817 domain-containing protein n=1 Tax=Catellatospora tritici TaxID=2851566 RepID=UPI001C2DCA1B|nr:DUF3817 domain-containing protein [Catellatospora tritici]MBV1849233.1 DUF3817 domain-containing protein [Catellatospora tritici]
MNGALTRYRVIAWIVGVMLLLLTLVAMPMKYFADDNTGVTVIAPIHGWLYVVYLVLAADLARRAQWGVKKMLVVALAGTIPFFSFVAERMVVGWIKGTDARPEFNKA